MHRILIIGVSGAGKTTLAEDIAHLLNLRFLATDSLYWKEDWQPVPIEHVMRLVEEHISQDRWVLDGNFEEQRHTIWPRSDTIIWLDYNLPLVLYRVTLRNVRWLLKGTVDWSGNRMTFRQLISSLRHSLRSYSRKKRLYAAFLRDLSGVTILRFHSPHETTKWLNNLYSCHGEMAGK
jgi:adenylate kinase family enzyme